ncbi:MAG: alpha/beta hydrolase-fold protein [Hyphomonadaceae bacterium]|nr:alpha/beta hydrolase-fold protein [Hyphomonadaceae bacterium]
MQTTPARTDGLVDVWVMVTVPPNSGDVYITGSLPQLGPWRPDALRMGDLDDPAGTERVVRLALPVGQTFEYKVTLGSWDREAARADGAALPNQRVQVTASTTATRLEVPRWKADPRTFMADVAGSGVKGTLIYWPDMASAHLSETRHASIWLPPGYADNPAKRYRVIYMSDGQNLFDPRIANTGIDWGVDEAMVAGMEAGRFEPAIIVSTWSTARRFQDYSPWHDAPKYARFLIEELMPRVNREYRTLTGPEHTFHMGSSMGGLLSYYLVANHPEVFSACGCVSTAFLLTPAMINGEFAPPVANPSTVPYVVTDIANGASVVRSQRFFFDYGTAGQDAHYGPSTRAVGDWLVRQGFVEGADFKIRAYPGADHNEAAWRARVGDQLDWLLGAR